MASDARLADGAPDLRGTRRPARYFRPRPVAPPSNIVERLYAVVDAFLSPSTYDAIGMVIAEQMASGLPVLVSHSAGAEFVEEGVTGHVLPSVLDGAEPARWLNGRSNDRAVLERMGAAARCALLPFPWDAVVEQTHAVCERAAGRRLP